MEDRLIKFKTAVAAKQKGFDIPIRYGVFGKKMKLCEDYGKTRFPSPRLHNWNTDRAKSFSVPTQSLLQKWLREVHNAHIIIVPEFYTTGINYNWQVLIFDPSDPRCISDISTGLYGDNGEYPTYEDALEAGLRKALELIENITL